MNFLDKTRKTVKKYKLIEKKNTILIGVSGGPDSVALLYVLNSLKKEFNLKLHIAHLNHMLRGRESLGDVEFVRNLARKLKFPFTIKEVDVANLSAKGSQEEIARKVRLNFLFKLAKKIKADRIALGHNMDDQGETVLMRLLRGAGLQGLAGILPKRQIDGFVVIRPLIETSRKDIEKFLKTRKIKPRRDSSNLDSVYFRNRIRHHLLPGLVRYNPNIKEVLANSAETIAFDYDYLFSCAKRVFKGICLTVSKRKLKLLKDTFLRQHPAMQNMIFRLAYDTLKGDTRRIAYQHIKELNSLVSERPVGSIVDLPSNISAYKTKRYLVFYKRPR